MLHSASAPSLRAAGASLAHSHVPRRATQHGIFLSSCQILPTDLKPGQRTVDRHLYGEEAKANYETYVGVDLPKGSVYAQGTSNHHLPEDYMFPTKSLKPSYADEEGGHRGTAHWQSNYKSTLGTSAIHGAVPHRQHGPSYQQLNPPTCLGRGEDLSAYQENHGRPGFNPMDRMLGQTNKMPVIKGHLTFGTTKGTSHIPGYSGFLPTNTANPLVAKIEQGGNERSVDKTNLTEAFHTNLVGYQGHKPGNARNDTGGVRPTRLTSTGRDFSAHVLNGYT